MPAAMDLRAVFLKGTVPIAGARGVHRSWLMDEILEEPIKARGELKAKITKIDKMDHELEGKSATTWLKWGSEFQIRLVKGQSEDMVEIYDL
jgi:hypothetical protein